MKTIKVSKWEYIDEAKRLEKNNQWVAAADVWLKINYTNDADTCKDIAKSIEKGNKFRSDCVETTGKYNLGLITKDEYYSEISRIYKLHF